MKNFCDSCKWWSYSYDGSMEKFGLCTNEMIEDKLHVSDEEYIDEPTIFTAATYGCIYHESKAKNLAVTAINTIINE